MTYKEKLLSLSAEKADLKSILIDLAKRADISIRYPASLDKEVTLQINESTLDNALDRILKGVNYSIIYTGTSKNPVISDVYVVDQNKNRSSARARTSSSSSSNNSRIETRIRSYERRIETLKKNLEKVDEDSTRGKSYSNRIQSYQKNIEKLKSQLN